MKSGDKRVAVVFGTARRKTKRHRQPYYDNKVLTVLRRIWMISDYLCGKSLSSFLKEVVSVLEKFGGTKVKCPNKTKASQNKPCYHRQAFERE